MRWSEHIQHIWPEVLGGWIGYMMHGLKHKAYRLIGRAVVAYKR